MFFSNIPKRPLGKSADTHCPQTAQPSKRSALVYIYIYPYIKTRLTFIYVLVLVHLALGQGSVLEETNKLLPGVHSRSITCPECSGIRTGIKSHGACGERIWISQELLGMEWVSPGASGGIGTENAIRFEEC